MLFLFWEIKDSGWRDDSTGLEIPQKKKRLKIENWRLSWCGRQEQVSEITNVLWQHFSDEPKFKVTVYRRWGRIESKKMSRRADRGLQEETRGPEPGQSSRTVYDTCVLHHGSKRRHRSRPPGAHAFSGQEDNLWKERDRRRKLPGMWRGFKKPSKPSLLNQESFHQYAHKIHK